MTLVGTDVLLPEIAVEDDQLSPTCEQFLEALMASSYRGEVDASYSARLAQANDNSIYQVLPEGILYPTSKEDIECIMAFASQEPFDHLSFCMRGGSTSTNGQSLTEGLLIDCSRHMHKIIACDLEEETVTVQPGVVLDELNSYLAEYGYWFPPSLSPSDRATIGGMFSTDACGKGSCEFGRTSDHVLSVEAVLSDGSVCHFAEQSWDEVTDAQARSGREGHIYQTLPELLLQHHQAIASTHCQMPRALTGYNLAESYDVKDGLNLVKCLSGSEGTLACITELTLRVRKKEAFKSLAVIAYPDFESALASGRDLRVHKFTAIETVDHNILNLAKTDPVYELLGLVLPDPGVTIGGINLIEYQHDNLRSVELKCHTLERVLDQAQEDGSVLGYMITDQPHHIQAFWGLRKKSVGLLANFPGEAQPVPFIEDTAVPPEVLPEYIEDFRKLLDQHGLQYGMFGHVDAGCLHVRPALNMQDPTHQALVPVLTDAVARLVKKYGGVMWGEHGRGYRTEWTEAFFGPELMPVLKGIKTLFDPHNRLNPGKIVAPEGQLYGEHLVKVDGPYRGYKDAEIDQQFQRLFRGAMKCNGNAACLQYNPDQVMCPSLHVTQNRVHSPKGRAAILREWSRRFGKRDGKKTKWRKYFLFQRLWNRQRSPEDFSHEVKEALDGCLGCKGCATSCPVRIDVPTMKAEFLSMYHTRYARSVRDVMMVWIEKVTAFQMHWPRLMQVVTGNALSRKLLEYVGLYDLPQADAYPLHKRMYHHGHHYYTGAKIHKQCALDQSRTVVLIQDAFTSAYEPDLFCQWIELLERLGYLVYVMPLHENGKPAHVMGALSRFEKLASRQAKRLNAISDRGIPMIGLDPSMTLVYRDEYIKYLGADRAPKVQLPQEWLATEVGRTGSPTSVWLKSAPRSDENHFVLFSHCSEQSLVSHSAGMWQSVFKAFGLSLQSVQTGCCGMSGAYGHLAEHQEKSQAIFAYSWSPKLDFVWGSRGVPLMTGFSCRCQVERLSPDMPRLHPISALHNRVMMG